MENKAFYSDTKWIWGSRALGKRFNNSNIETRYFRKKFQSSDGNTLFVNISADSRYTLFINNHRVTTGPAKGDIAHHFYERLDVTKYLENGENYISAVVTCFAAAHPDYSGTCTPVSVMTAMPAFIVEASLTDSKGEIVCSLSTDSSWETLNDKAVTHIESPNFVVISDANECVNYNFYPEGWQIGKDSGFEWFPAVELTEAVRADTVVDSPMPYRLTERIIPLLRSRDERFISAHGFVGISKEQIQGLIDNDLTIKIEKNSTVSFVLRSYSTTAYPIIKFNGGYGAKIRLTYSEGLYKDGVKVPDIDFDGDVVGMFDEIICDGNLHTFEPSHFRTFRFIKVEITTKREPLEVLSLTHRFSAYPFDKNCEFKSSSPEHEKILDISFRTLELCSHETFEDCPYYEQMQYMGDSQVISLIAAYASGDLAMSKQLILHFYWSLDNEGFPQSRYPSRIPQKIISWALLWAVGVYDYYMLSNDKETVGEVIDGVIRMLEWFYKYIGERGLLHKLPYWKVVDWVWEWRNNYGAPEGAIDGTSGLISAQYAYALQQVAKILPDFEKTQKADEFLSVSQSICDAVNRHCFDNARKLYKDSPDHELSSELSNSWAILAGCADKELAFDICSHFEVDESIAKATMYGRFYVFRALSACGAYDKFSDMLKLWYTIMDKNVDTWPEEPRFARSFCHAWSASPLYEFLSEILGIKPLSPGFEKVLIAPKSCGLKFAHGKVPTIKGDIYVDWRIENGEMKVNYTVPHDVKVVVIPEK